MAIAVINQISPNIVQSGSLIAISGLNLDGTFNVFYGSNGPYIAVNSNPNLMYLTVPPLGIGTYSLTLQNNSGTSNSFDITVSENVTNSIAFCPTEYNEADYVEAQLRLLPRGLAWLFPQDSVWRKLFAGIAQELLRIQGRSCDLIKESFPLLADEMLTEWEQDLGLPDSCSPNVNTDLNSRRNQVLRKLSMQGGQSIAYYTKVAKSLGFDIRITENFGNPFIVGVGRVGESLDNISSYYWTVTAIDFELSEFRVGLNTVGQPLRFWGDLELECLLNQIKPAHTAIIFEYIDPTLLDFINENTALSTDIINENTALVTNIINENPV